MAQDLYGTYGSVSDVAPEGASGARPFSVRANGADFGGQIGAEMEQAGKVGQQLGNEQLGLATSYAKMATEAKVNDDYASKYAPAAAQLRDQYDTLRGQDKIAGYDGYIQGLQNLNQQFVGNTASPYEKQLMGGLITRHITNEIDGAKRELVESQKQFADQAMYDKITAETGYAARNYNNPGVVAQTEQTIDGTIANHFLNAGHDPENPADMAAIDQAQRQAKGSLAVGMVKSAISRGDAQSANGIYASYGSLIPGDQQAVMDPLLHTENMRQTGTQGVQALKAGEPLPHAVGAPAAHVQALVADTAHDKGIPPNDLLTAVRIESSYGQNTGKRGDIGQTGKGGDLGEQAKNMADSWQEAHDAAQKHFGRDPLPWETYAFYQQGQGGAAAMFKNMTAKAVDVLMPLYKSPKQALQAIQNNGGNATMTCKDFLTMINGKWQRNAQAAQCEFKGPEKEYPDMETKLSPEEETKFQSWMDQQHAAGTIQKGDYDYYKKNGYGYDYDFRAAFQAGLKPEMNPNDHQWHWGDLGKKPNEPTFSDQSKYAKDYPDLAGKWEGEGPDAKFIKASSPGQQIMAPHEHDGETVQPAATPRQALDNFDLKYPQMMDRINAVPNIEVRQSLQRILNRERETVAAASTAYTQHLSFQAQQLAANPKFTSMDMVPPDLAAELMVNNPLAYNAMENRAKQNLERSSGAVSEEQKHYGPAFFDLVRGIHDGTVTSDDQLLAHLPGAAGDLTQAGRKELQEELKAKGDSPDKLGPDMKTVALDIERGNVKTPTYLTGKYQSGGLTLGGYDKARTLFANTPEEKANTALISQTLATIKGGLSEKDKYSIDDPKGEMAFLQAQPKIMEALIKAKNDGSLGEVTDPENPKYVGNLVKGLKRTPVQANADVLAANPEGFPVNRLIDTIAKDYAGATPDKQDALKREAAIAIHKALMRGEDEAKLRQFAETMGLIQAEVRAPDTSK